MVADSGVIAIEATTNGDVDAAEGFWEYVDSSCSAATRVDCEDDDNSSSDMSFLFFWKLYSYFCCFFIITDVVHLATDTNWQVCL